MRPQLVPPSEAPNDKSKGGILTNWTKLHAVGSGWMAQCNQSQLTHAGPRVAQLELPIGECKDHACSSCFGTLAATPPFPSGYTTPSDDRLRSPGIVTFNLLYHDLVSLGHCAFFLISPML